VCCLDQAIDVAGTAMSQAATLLAAPFVSSPSYEFANMFFALDPEPFVLLYTYFRRNCFLFPTAFRLSISTGSRQPFLIFKVL
jgi:hypothetical protein